MLSSTLRLAALCVGCAGLLACAGTQKLDTTPPTRPAVAPAVTLTAAASRQPPAATDPAPVAEPPAPPLAADGGAAPVSQPEAESQDESRFVDVVSEEGQRARGLYFNGPMAKRLGTRGLIDQVKNAGLNAVVIDIKDGEGRVTFDTQVPELQAEKHVFLSDASQFVRTLKDAGIYTIARVVCFSDPVLPKQDPERAVHDGRPGHEGDIWEKNAKRNTWLDPYNTKNHDTIVAIAKEVEALGFDEIQLDYIRFPVDPATKFAVFSAQVDKPRGQVLLGLLRRIDEAVHIPLGVDVFGLTALKKGDPGGQLGQDLEAWAAHVEVFSPMLYVNGMKEWMHNVTQGRAGLLVQEAVSQLRERVGSGPVIRPFLQAFEKGADYYNGEFIAEQIRGSRQGGGDGFLFWHPGSNYGMVRTGMMGPARVLFPFPIDARKAFREDAWSKAQGKAPGAPMRAVADEPTTKPAS